MRVEIRGEIKTLQSLAPSSILVALTIAPEPFDAAVWRELRTITGPIRAPDPRIAFVYFRFATGSGRAASRRMICAAPPFADTLAGTPAGSEPWDHVYAF